MTYTYPKSATSISLCRDLERTSTRLDEAFDEVEELRIKAVERLLKEREKRERTAQGREALRADANAARSKAGR